MPGTVAGDTGMRKTMQVLPDSPQKTTLKEQRSCTREDWLNFWQEQLADLEEKTLFFRQILKAKQDAGTELTFDEKVHYERIRSEASIIKEQIAKSSAVHRPRVAAPRRARPASVSIRRVPRARAHRSVASRTTSTSPPGTSSDGEPEPAPCWPNPIEIIEKITTGTSRSQGGMRA